MKAGTGASREELPEGCAADEAGSIGDEEGNRRDILFVLGFFTLLVFLILANPDFPEVPHRGLLFWTSASMLFLSMAPEHWRGKPTEEWLSKYGETRIGSLLERIRGISGWLNRHSDHYLPFFAGVALLAAGMLVLFFRGRILEPVLGISYGLLARTVLG